MVFLGRKTRIFTSMWLKGGYCKDFSITIETHFYGLPIDHVFEITITRSELLCSQIANFILYSTQQHCLVCVCIYCMCLYVCVCVLTGYKIRGPANCLLQYTIIANIIIIYILYIYAYKSA